MTLGLDQLVKIFLSLKGILEFFLCFSFHHLPILFVKLYSELANLSELELKEWKEVVTMSEPNFAKLGLHLGFSAEQRIWQVPACKMEPQRGIILQ